MRRTETQLRWLRRGQNSCWLPALGYGSRAVAVPGEFVRYRDANDVGRPRVSSSLPPPRPTGTRADRESVHAQRFIDGICTRARGSATRRILKDQTDPARSAFSGDTPHARIRPHRPFVRCPRPVRTRPVQRPATVTCSESRLADHPSVVPRRMLERRSLRHGLSTCRPAVVTANRRLVHRPAAVPARLAAGGAGSRPGPPSGRARSSFARVCVSAAHRRPRGSVACSTNFTVAQHFTRPAPVR